MGRSVTVEIDGAGEVLFEKSKRSKYVNIFVMPFKGVRVAIPYGVSFEEAVKEARSKIKWIKKHLARMKKVEEEYSPELNPAFNEKEAKKILVEKTRYFAKVYGFAYNKITLRRQRTRWGSCSQKNNLSLNLKLAQLPDDLCDYVILHELMHTRVKNHGKIFWSEMEKLVKGAKKVDARLRKYHLELI